MNPIVKYLQDTRMELRHVAWPTRTQTIVYTVLTIALSVGVALYLGLFDYIFTNMLSRSLSALPDVAPIQVQQQIPNPDAAGAAGGTALAGSPEAQQNDTKVDNGPLKIIPGEAQTVPAQN